jgi:ferrous-iron efflux pump FieF
MTDKHTKLSLSAAIASVSVAAVLIGLKLWALVATHSLSVGATLLDSMLDLFISAAGLAAIAYAARPPDHDHTFGHSSAEDLAALGQAAFLIVAAIGLVGVSIFRLLSDQAEPLRAQGLGMTVIGISIILTMCLVAWQSYVAARTGNRVVAADMLHYVGDLLPNLGAVGALWASARFGVGGVDIGVALLAAGAMIWGACRIGLGAWNALMDRQADPELIAAVGAIICDHAGIKSFHDMRSRTAGSRVFLDFHVEIDGDLSLHEAHRIGASLKWRILSQCPQVDVLIHKDPWQSDLIDSKPPLDT